MFAKFVGYVVIALLAVVIAGFFIPTMQPYTIAAMIALMVIALLFTVAAIADHKASVDHFSNKK